MIPLKYIEIFLINYEDNLMVTWSAICVLSSNASANQEATFRITEIGFTN